MHLYFVLLTFETWELRKERGEGKLEDCEMELVMMRRGGEAALRRRGLRSLISRWWESTLTAKVVSTPELENIEVIVQDSWTNQKGTS